MRRCRNCRCTETCACIRAGTLERCSWIEDDLCSACADGWLHAAPPAEEEVLLLTATQTLLVAAAAELHPEVAAISVKRGEGFVLHLTALDEEARATAGLQWTIDGLALRRDTALEDMQASFFDESKWPITFGTAISDAPACGETTVEL